MTKRILAILLSAMLLVGLFTACSGNTPAATTAATTAAATTAATTAAATTAAATTAAATTAANTTKVTTAPSQTTPAATTATTAPGSSLEMSDIPGMTAPGVIPIVTEPVTLTIGFIPSASCTDYEDNLFTKYVEENSGIDVEFFFFPSDGGEATQKLQLMVASNQTLPDIWSGISLTAGEKYALGRDGYALDIDPLMEKYEYFWSRSLRWASDIDKKNMEIFSRSVDGKMYTMPVSSADPTDNTSTGMYINEAWLNQLGLAVPTTTTELKDVLIAFRDNDLNGNGQADEIPMMFAIDGWASGFAKLICGWFGCYWGQYTMDVENGQCYYPFVTDEYRQAVTYMRNLTDEGLLSPLSFTITSEQYRPLIDCTDNGQPQTIGVFCDHPYITFSSMHMYDALDYVYLPTLTAENGTTPYATYSASFTSFSTMISAKTEHPEICFRLLDWFCDEKTAISARFGEYGTHWCYVEDADINLDEVDFPTALMGYKPYWVCYENPFITKNNYVWRCTSIYMIPPELFGSYVSVEGGDTGGVSIPGAEKYAEEFHKSVAERLAHLPEEMIANLILTEDEQIEIAEIKTSIDSYQKECLTAFITGNMDIESGWDNYVDTLNAIGLEQYVNIVQTAWTRMTSN